MRYKERELSFAPEQIRHGGRRLFIFLLILVMLIGAVLIVNIVINGQVQLVSQSVSSPFLSSSMEGFKILHISDLHGARFGAQQHGIEARIQNLKYNCVVITGDSVAPNGDYTALIEVLDLIDDKVPVFLIAGDEDPAPILTAAGSGYNVKADYILAAERHGAIYLDTPYLMTVGKSNLWICPATTYTMDADTTRRSMEASRRELTEREETADQQAALRAVDYWLDVIDRTEEMRAQMKTGDFKICVSHAPFTAETIDTLRYQENGDLRNNAKPVTLVLAGHYNNGQAHLPGLGPILVPARVGIYDTDRWFPGTTRLSGVSTLSGITQYVSPGLGSAAVYAPFSFRFLNPPALTLLTLTTKMVD
ncbi:MAG: metallophosphoesterase [Clostridia bacterium]|nr:metallophosphoesterase [Clostridia bacterium]